MAPESLMNSNRASRSLILGWTFRVALFAAAASLAAYIPFKYATQLHAISGLYALLFPLSAILALAGMVVAWKPKAACDCSMPVRAGVGAVSVLWLVTGLLCVKTLADGIDDHPVRGTFAMFHMVTQHVFLSLGVLAFALMPERMARAAGAGTFPAQGSRDTARIRRAPV